MSDAILSIWTIYDRPRDFPNTFVARRHEAMAGATRPTQDVMICTDLERLRDHLARMGLTMIPREPGDDPMIVESWL